MIYFIRCELSRRIKIGFATNPWARLTKIQSDSPGDVAVLALEPGGVERERELHAQFASARVRGEWFNPSPELCVYIATLPAATRPQKSKSRAFWGGATDEEVAANCSIHRATITRIRQGRHRPTAQTAIEIQRATGMSAVRLVFGDLAEEAIAHALAAPISEAA